MCNKFFRMPRLIAVILNDYHIDLENLAIKCILILFISSINIKILLILK